MNVYYITEPYEICLYYDFNHQSKNNRECHYKEIILKQLNEWKDLL